MNITKNERLLIKAITKLNKQGIEYPTSTELDRSLKLHHKEILLTAKHLEKGGLAHVEFIHPDDRTDIGLIELTYEGAHCIEYTWLETRVFLFQSIFVPIGVSLLTSSIVFWLINCVF